MQPLLWSVAFRFLKTWQVYDPVQGGAIFMLDRVIAEAGLDRNRIARIGLGTPGTMDISKGILLSPGNLPGWWNFPIRDALAKASGRHFFPQCRGTAIVSGL